MDNEDGYDQANGDKEYRGEVRTAARMKMRRTAARRMAAARSTAVRTTMARPKGLRQGQTQRGGGP